MARTAKISSRTKEGSPVEQPMAALLADQLEFTSVVLLNKVDRALEATRARLEDFIQELNPCTQICRTVRGQIEPEKPLHTGLYHHREGLAYPDWEIELIS